VIYKPAITNAAARGIGATASITDDKYGHATTWARPACTGANRSVAKVNSLMSVLAAGLAPIRRQRHLA
jgi:hypothetical protein